MHEATRFASVLKSAAFVMILLFNGAGESKVAHAQKSGDTSKRRRRIILNGPLPFFALRIEESIE